MTRDTAQAHQDTAQAHQDTAQAHQDTAQAHQDTAQAHRDTAQARREIAIACRVLAHRGLVEDILGHISLRLDNDHLLVRCRGPEESGLRFTVAEDIHIVKASSGKIIDDSTDAYSPPSELPIHTSILAARPDVECVVHAHPPNVVVASLAGLELTSLFGAYNIPATRAAAAGIPVHPRSVLVASADLAAEMVATLGRSPGVILKGHGVVTTGGSVAEAVLLALHIDTLARITIGVHTVGGVPEAIPAADMAELPDLGSGFNEETLWRHHLASLDADGYGLNRTAGPSQEDPE